MRNHAFLEDMRITERISASEMATIFNTSERIAEMKLLYKTVWQSVGHIDLPTTKLRQKLTTVIRQHTGIKFAPLLLYPLIISALDIPTFFVKSQHS